MRAADGVLLGVLDDDPTGSQAVHDVQVVTAADIHWARSGSGLVRVGETEFARDAAFGYTASDLKAFISEKVWRGGLARRGAQHQPGRHQARRAGASP